MNDATIIDQFLQTFIRYIDSGFGLLGSDVRFLTATLIGIDITLAGLFWAMGGESDVLSRLIRKILYVGVFAYIINQFSALADIIFRSFTSAGLTASGGAMSADDLLRPGKLAGTGFDAARPLLDQISKLAGFTTFFDNFLTIVVLLFAWALIILAFFVLAVQVFVTILEFKLTALAGFVLVPFALWNRTAFLAERVLGNVVSSGIKVMVLAVIIGIGSNFFSQFTNSLAGQEPDIAQAMSLVLASLTLFGLGIFGPGIASGLVAGAPQLGAGAALGTAVGAAGVTALGGMAAAGAVGAAGAGVLSAVRAGTTMGSAANAAFQLGQSAAGSKSISAGLKGVAQAVGNSVRDRVGSGLGLREAANRGRDAAWNAMAGHAANDAGGAPQQQPPAWATAMRRRQEARHHGQAAVQTLREGDRGGASAAPDIREKED
ncbi:MAG TPA: P-type conjugative transfer protein TrbL [Sphingomonas sp.]|uniref:P-type conjugative transfer protein TrbL n=1 Tax=Sphingomonas sp. TaxID=28214 RepID=UPI002C4C9663|nr:P-type conjugative transfer protein TrbL [Sphingomonas sp.]HMI19378.1 P-type conjugative transfer protein TrbL [Sphingomonas sp.]